jgi:hypothetical protein
MIFSGFFPKELIYRKTLVRASKFGRKAKMRKLKGRLKRTFRHDLNFFENFHFSGNKIILAVSNKTVRALKGG